MRYKMLIIIFLISIFLVACQESKVDQIELYLNPGIDTIELNTTYDDPGATAKFGHIALNVKVISNTLDNQTLGTYEIMYEARYQTQIKRVKRVLIVVDTTPPKLTLNPGIDTIKIGQTLIDEGIHAEDESDIIDITVFGEVQNDIGMYVITYRFTDIHGNASFIQRVVHVIA